METLRAHAEKIYDAWLTAPLEHKSTDDNITMGEFIEVLIRGLGGRLWQSEYQEIAPGVIQFGRK